VRCLTTRPTLLITLLVAGVVLVACSNDSDSKTTKSKPKSAAATTSPAPTTPADPAACLRGTFRFTRMDYDGPVQTAFAPTTIVGGIAGRRIELKPDNTFHFTDHGREQVQFSLQRQGGSVPGTAVLKAQADGIYVPTATTSTFDITALQGSLTLTFYDGSTTNIALPRATGTRSRFASRLFRGFH
jgi:hypothetical protein